MSHGFIHSCYMDSITYMPAQPDSAYSLRPIGATVRSPDAEIRAFELFSVLVLAQYPVAESCLIVLNEVHESLNYIISLHLPHKMDLLDLLLISCRRHRQVETDGLSSSVLRLICVSAWTCYFHCLTVWLTV